MNNLIVTADVVLVSRGTKEGKNGQLYIVGFAQNENVGAFFVTEEIYNSLEKCMYKNLIATFQFMESKQYDNRLKLIELKMPGFEPIPFMEQQEDNSQPEGKPVTKNDKK